MKGFAGEQYLLESRLICLISERGDRLLSTFMGRTKSALATDSEFFGRPTFCNGGTYDCVGFASLDRRNMAPKHVSPAPRR